MKITKIGHCCLLIETKGKRILTDPGSFTTEQNFLENIDLVLITHEHADHFHIDSLKEIMKNNPSVTIISNSSVGKLLEMEGIVFTLLEGRKTGEFIGIQFEAFDNKHEEIYEDIGQVQNTGYFVDSKLFYPGDSFCNPNKDVPVLALPVAGPWCKLSDAIRYAIAVKPKSVFPVHDAILKKELIGLAHRIPEMVLKQNGIEFYKMVEGDTKEF